MINKAKKVRFVDFKQTDWEVRVVAGFGCKELQKNVGSRDMNFTRREEAFLVQSAVF